jgi:hypothetical protein
MMRTHTGCFCCKSIEYARIRIHKYIHTEKDICNLGQQDAHTGCFSCTSIEYIRDTRKRMREYIHAEKDICDLGQHDTQTQDVLAVHP